MLGACRPWGLNADYGERQETSPIAHRVVAAGAHLYRAGDDFRALFTICSGAFKTEQCLDDGRQQVLRFHLEGDVLGVEGIASGVHTCDAVALDVSRVCVIPYERAGAGSPALPDLLARMQRVMSAEIVREHREMLLLRVCSAEERLAEFLLAHSQRLRARGRSPNDFLLPMSRREIGSYLGVEIETISRLFSKFRRSGFISAKLRSVRILDMEGLASCMRGRQ